MIRRYGERYLERELYVDWEIEVFKLSRSYKELIKRLELEKNRWYETPVSYTHLDVYKRQK